jgi:hypothetical protein
MTNNVSSLPISVQSVLNKYVIISHVGGKSNNCTLNTLALFSVSLPFLMDLAFLNTLRRALFFFTLVNPQLPLATQDDIDMQT